VSENAAADRAYHQSLAMITFEYRGIVPADICAHEGYSIQFRRQGIAAVTILPAAFFLLR
jgi:hypothetical protein